MSHRLSLRRAFTLTELLVVISIIGVLMSLVSVAAYRAFLRGQEARIMAEVGQLTNAMQMYRDQTTGYPPNMGDNTSALRIARFNAHIKKAWPRTTITYASLRTNMQSKRDPNTNNYAYTYKTPDGSIQYLNLDTLDQAESLVFWLGGFPTPWDSQTTAAIAPRRLFGFHKDPVDPFKRDPRTAEAPRPLDFRSEPRYGFDEIRLVDQDGDGWWEYVPPGRSSGGASAMAPYVYFDWGAYTSTSPSGTITYLPYPDPVSNSQLAAEWGIATPYALFFDPNQQSPARWVEAERFQIICAGRDNRFSQPSSQMRVGVFPAGHVFRQEDNYGEITAYDPEELDNIVNFSNRKLGDEQTAAQ